MTGVPRNRSHGVFGAPVNQGSQPAKGGRRKSKGDVRVVVCAEVGQIELILEAVSLTIASLVIETIWDRHIGTWERTFPTCQ